jgi:hypothetical protein
MADGYWGGVTTHQLSTWVSDGLPHALLTQSHAPPGGHNMWRMLFDHATADACCCAVCVLCAVQTTPVWRAGPAGPKTLCNACGVRFMKIAKRKA